MEGSPSSALRPSSGPRLTLAGLDKRRASDTQSLDCLPTATTPHGAPSSGLPLPSPSAGSALLQRRSGTGSVGLPPVTVCSPEARRAAAPPPPPLPPSGGASPARRHPSVESSHQRGPEACRGTRLSEDGLAPNASSRASSVASSTIISSSSRFSSPGILSKPGAPAVRRHPQPPMSPSSPSSPSAPRGHVHVHPHHHPHHVQPQAHVHHVHPLGHHLQSFTAAAAAAAAAGVATAPRSPATGGGAFVPSLEAIWAHVASLEHKLEASLERQGELQRLQAAVAALQAGQADGPVVPPTAAAPPVPASSAAAPEERLSACEAAIRELRAGMCELQRSRGQLQGEVQAAAAAANDVMDVATITASSAAAAAAQEALAAMRAQVMALGHAVERQDQRTVAMASQLERLHEVVATGSSHGGCGGAGGSAPEQAPQHVLRLQEVSEQLEHVSRQQALSEANVAALKGRVADLEEAAAAAAAACPTATAALKAAAAALNCGGGGDGGHGHGRSRRHGSIQGQGLMLEEFGVSSESDAGPPASSEAALATSSTTALTLHHEQVELRLTEVEEAVHDLMKRVSRGLSLRVTRDEMREGLDQLHTRCIEAVSACTSRATSYAPGTRAPFPEDGDGDGGADAAVMLVDEGPKGAFRRAAECGEPFFGEGDTDSEDASDDPGFGGVCDERLNFRLKWADQQEAAFQLRQAKEAAAAAALSVVVSDSDEEGDGGSGKAAATAAGSMQGSASLAAAEPSAVGAAGGGAAQAQAAGARHKQGSASARSAAVAELQRSLEQLRHRVSAAERSARAGNRRASVTAQENAVLHGFEEQLVLLSARMQANEDIEKEQASELQYLKQAVSDVEDGLQAMVERLAA